MVAAAKPRSIEIIAISVGKNLSDALSVNNYVETYWHLRMSFTLCSSSDPPSAEVLRHHGVLERLVGEAADRIR